MEPKTQAGYPLPESATGKEADSGTSDRPYDDLYIYLLEGVVVAEYESYLGQAFIGNWVEDNSSFLFFGRPADKAVNRLVKEFPQFELVEAHHFTYDQWQGGGLETIKVDKFVVVPPWKQADADEGSILIVLDPGVVFGNGLHPTTRDCLKALSYAYGQQPFQRVLDLGTGTGVLALAAAFLGAEGVLAVDINPLCVKTAMRNIGLNRLHDIIRTVEGPAEHFVDEPSDLVVANIHHEVIERLLDRGAFRDTDRFVISGLMRSQFRDVRSRLEKNRFRILREWDHDMTWFTLLAMKEFG